MKKNIIKLILLLLPFTGYTQNSFNTEKNDSTNIYYFVIKEFCKIHANYGDTLFIEKERMNISNLPNNISGVIIKYLDIGDISHLTTKRKTIKLYRIIPLRFEESGFFINIIQFDVSRKRKSLFYHNRDGKSFHFKYECGKGLTYIP
ncbi:MAG TPA: hypothetical protein PKH93_01875 [Chitinophagales bacterium]|nr:hypothetical protein [Chitinophagales bacterium]